VSTDHNPPRYVVLTTPLFLVPPGPKYLPQHSILECPQPMSYLNVTDQASHTHTHTHTHTKQPTRASQTYEC